MGGGRLEHPNLVFGYPFVAEHTADVLEKRPAVLEVDEGAVKGPVEGAAPHGSAACVARAGAAAVRVHKARRTPPQQFARALGVQGGAAAQLPEAGGGGAGGEAGGWG